MLKFDLTPMEHRRRIGRTKKQKRGPEPAFVEECDRLSICE
jgi:hypothetical protein